MTDRDPIDAALAFLARWIIVCSIAAAILILASCGPKCPKPPPCVPPTPVVVIQRPPPCTLPALPEPIEGLGVPDATRDGYFVPRQRWAELGGYVAGVHAWVRAATDCLTATTEPKP